MQGGKDTILRFLFVSDLFASIQLHGWHWAHEELE